MWVHETGCLAFVHIPKNGGTTVTDQLKLSGKFIGHTSLKKLNPAVDKHDTAATMRAMLKNLFPNPILFATLRHPYHRVFSMWCQMVEVNKKYVALPDIPHKEYSAGLLEKYGTGAKGFAAFIEEMPPWHYHPKNGKLEDMAYDGWWSQTKWVCNKNNEIIVDKLFYIDDLKALEDWIPRYGVKFLSHLHANVKGNFNPRLFYNKDTLALVRKKFEDDFEKFGFTEELI